MAPIHDIVNREHKKFSDESGAKKVILLDSEGNQITEFASPIKQDEILEELKQKTEPSDTQKISAVSLPLPSGAATSANQILIRAELQTLNSLIPSVYDYISLSQTSTTDVWVFKNGGSGGSTVSTITITYTDASKETIANIAKT